MRINLRLVLTFLAIVVSATLWAAVQQEIRISGTVISDGEPLPGVSVQIKGETTGTITDMDGKYSISAPSDAILVYRFVGLKTVEQSVNGRNMINVTLESDSKELDEVMVVAYATAKKYSFTGAASTVKGDEIAKLQVASVSRALEGTVSGVQASAASGQPGTDAEIRIRGIGSINASSAPLYVVDGVPFDGSVNSINPDDIASMTVLKDAASAALYGSRGANGVIIITTKQGQTDSKTTVNVKASFGGSNRAVRDYDRIGTNDYFQLYWEALRNQYAKDTENYTPATAAAQASKDLVTKLMGDGPNPYGTNYPQPVGTDGKLVDGARPLWDFDWSDAMEQQALRTELNLNVSGGGQKNQYFFSAGYLNDKGIALESGYQRFNLRSNISVELIKDKLILEADVNYDTQNNKASTRQNSVSGDATLSLILDRAGNLRVQAFTRTIEDFNPNQGTQESGIGIFYRENFNSFKDLVQLFKDRFANIARRRAERKAAKRQRKAAEHAVPAVVKTSEGEPAGREETPVRAEGE